ncbi:ParB/RepB/Spo0J family partition protein [Oleiharenicola lentus]|uniref:ParB/RepB/Spo0J family partition protein n=1 Tax=Oleiharenicola lentus TaxID=2508720 RepID=UPI003F663670
MAKSTQKNSAGASDTAAATAELPLNQFEWNENSVCTNPEKILVKLPKGCRCEIELASFSVDDSAPVWYAGYTLDAGDNMVGSPCSHGLGHASFPTRDAALLSALETAEKFFSASPKNKVYKKCYGEVTAFVRSLGSSPANIRPALSRRGQHEPLPTPQELDIEIARIEPHPNNPRGSITPESVAELRATIVSEGLLQRVGIRILAGAAGLPGLAAENRLQLLWGHRRLEACRGIKGMLTIPARVYENISDEQARVLLNIENDQRKDLDPIEQARGYADMMRDFDMTQDDVAKTLNKSRPVIANALRLLGLPEDSQKRIANRSLTTAHGTALASYADFPAVCARITELVIQNETSAGEIEEHLLFEDVLKREGLIIKCPNDYEPPEEIARSFRQAWSAIGHYCLDPEVWKGEAARLVAEKKEERAKKKARDEKGSNNKVAEKKELTPDDGDVVNADDVYLLDLVPEDKVAKGKTYAGNKCTLVLDKQLWAKVIKARNDVLSEDATAKASPMIEAGWKRAAGIKKIDDFAGACLIMMNPLRVGDLGGDIAKRLELDLGRFEKKVLIPPSDQWSKAKTRINELAKIDPVPLAKLSLGQMCAEMEGILKEKPWALVDNMHWLQFISGDSAFVMLDAGKAKGQEEIMMRMVEKLAPSSSKEAVADKTPEKFNWDKKGNCSNPMRINLPVPAPAKVSILTAQSAPCAAWSFGYDLSLPGIGGSSHPLRLKEATFMSRAAAVAGAISALREDFNGHGAAAVPVRNACLDFGVDFMADCKEAGKL